LNDPDSAKYLRPLGKGYFVVSRFHSRAAGFSRKLRTGGD